jgi:16S rRNA (adenine1518-N6/adenine1519-N6)-dimethyltransferase
MDPRQLLRQFDIKPKKSLGQNFLVDEGAAEHIAAAADLTPDDVVLEVGPGLGALTRCLAGACARVVAVELDQRLIPVLQHTLADFSNVEIIHGDVMALQPSAMLPSAYKVVANIPYYITSALLRHLLEADVRPSLMVLTIQEEVARRIVARPDDMSLLAVSVQFYGRAEIVSRLKPGAFFPAPKVRSAVVRVDLRSEGQPALAVADADLFFRLARAGFGQRRKQLRNALVSGTEWSRSEVEEALAAAGLDPRRRAETLTLEEWAALAAAMPAAQVRSVS